MGSVVFRASERTVGQLEVMCHSGGGETEECALHPPHTLTSITLVNHMWGTSLMARWLRIHLPVQETQVPSLIREDATCLGATEPTRHSP